jgi:hypothetical protein
VEVCRRWFLTAKVNHRRQPPLANEYNPSVTASVERIGDKGPDFQRTTYSEAVTAAGIEDDVIAINESRGLFLDHVI